MPSIIKRVTLAAFLIAAFNFFWPVFIAIGEGFYETATIETADSTDDHFTLTECHLGGPRLHQIAHFWLVPLTLVALMGTRFTGLHNTFLTIVGLLGSTYVYLSWWRVVFRISDGAIPISSIQHYGYLSGGNILDLFLAAIIALLIVMNITVSLPRSH